MRWPWKKKPNALADELRRVADTIDRLYPNSQAVAVCLSLSDGGGSYYTFEERRSNGEVVAALLKMRAEGAPLQVVK